jgi:hypothetical protein
VKRALSIGLKGPATAQAAKTASKYLIIIVQFWEIASEKETIDIFACSLLI